MDFPVGKYLLRQTLRHQLGLPLLARLPLDLPLHNVDFLLRFARVSSHDDPRRAHAIVRVCVRPPGLDVPGTAETSDTTLLSADLSPVARAAHDSRSSV